MARTPTKKQDRTALDALHTHLRRVSRTTTKENEIIHQMELHMDKIIMGLIKLSRHTQNRIAAHKAHLTMAKNKAKGRTRKAVKTERDEQREWDGK